ncbi:hypothetical protein RHMOL_Rhmol09G0114300 [Rhododendron molle]|uniref:Uncharacterized protein n=1 Tax=Rhododendron molle TaxID=49168 RepID=A0ACC0MC71_RHOML|nr:hypothetical protein RHMOL_Rhmol09G0114300 [Rhododendron molle]
MYIEDHGMYCDGCNNANVSQFDEYGRPLSQVLNDHGAAVLEGKSIGKVLCFSPTASMRPPRKPTNATLSREILRCKYNLSLPFKDMACFFSSAKSCASASCGSLQSL